MVMQIIQIRMLKSQLWKPVGYYYDFHIEFCAHLSSIHFSQMRCHLFTYTALETA